jgi:hypothetical protein
MGVYLVYVESLETELGENDSVSFLGQLTKGMVHPSVASQNLVLLTLVKPKPLLHTPKPFRFSSPPVNHTICIIVS